MIIGIPREIKDNEFRAAIVPSGVRILTGKGHTVLIQTNAGIGSGISDDEYQTAGGELVSSEEEIFSRSDLIVKVKEPLPREYPLIRREQVLFTFLHLASDRRLTDALINSGVVAIAYEAVQLDNGALPILIPMSEIAGRMASIVAAYYLQESQGGAGVLISGVPGVAPGKVTILGAGTVGQNAARIAIGLGAQVVMLDRDSKRLKYIDDVFNGRVITLASNEHNIEEEVLSSDIVIGAVLVPGARAPYLIKKELISKMKKGAVIVDVSIDQGGCIETSKPTTHSCPVYSVDGVIHYCVVNMPGAFPRTSTFALCNSTIPYIIKLADLGWKKAVEEDPALGRGVTILGGRVTCHAVADTFGLKYNRLTI
ncbi:MAG: alanine dehydrogenase [Nitrospirae bacterium RIFCSPLOW2_12_42_9]|uniref:Alanine dehydrogenase n=1 Tax=Candidatus Uhrbacteria bacterium GW2011_GWF2_41_16 TaxID=1618997 RepID=A0A0G0XGS5_9BACT|nr:MAG: Alanine dehydrogenase [Candidatus Uhrbacteria bacterium GW2011_GWF2_41_16]OGW13627.1 MAG: alanine dehydrogenase [Nitrospirae bacterium GWA2_42_11]OGW55220.1 MAG: alanine dehydrogenase [Nitrospirae bacterium RIFCSPLOWO2_02_42_7]OGW55444.1 MAG: alanine dehydrogenase [Nitrospirae bacterium RIFCSPHIGHO2_02_FULL_42_12]OGW61822.1 MAG: alanine dehydrogenase [Nitrospirae bacterium RIFCSPLOW2_12_42_9]HAS16902.1 alanine dehydrogenase [Nitrospiraceae bacterium]